MATEFTAAEAIVIARAAGLDVGDLERQTKKPETSALQERVKELEARLEELTEKQPSEPQTAHERQVALAQQEGQALLSAMRRRSIGPFGWAGDDDGPAAA